MGTKVRSGRRHDLKFHALMTANQLLHRTTKEMETYLWHSNLHIYPTQFAKASILK